MSRRYETPDHARESSSSSEGPAPGKRTLTQSIPLRADVRERFEQSLGADLGGVRVHTGDEAAASAASVGARAYATGNDIYFGAGQYQPDDPFGLHLLAHEVAHTQQQAGAPAPHAQYKLEVSQEGDASEGDADRAADAMVHGLPARVTTVAGPSIARSAEGAPKGAVLLTFEQVDAVWKAWVKQKKRAMKTPPGDPAPLEAALAPTKKQVGDLNYKNWREAGGGLTYFEEDQVTPWTAEEHAQYDKEHPPEKPKVELPYEMTMAGMRAGQAGRIKGYSNKASAIHQAINAAERQCAKLATPDGAMGVASDIVLGVYGLAYGVGANAVSAARDTVNPVVQGVNMATKGQPEVPVDDAKDMAKTAQVSVDVMCGRLNSYYQQTRGSYAAYDAAYKAFCSARSDFNSARSEGDKNAAEDAASAAIDAMVAAAKEYLAVCQALGIPAKAAGVDALGAAIQKGMASAVEVGVDVLAGGAGEVAAEAPKAVEVGLEATKQAAKEAGKTP